MALSSRNKSQISEIFDRLVYKALLSRRVEEALLRLFSEGKLFGTVHTCIGQEFSGAVVSEFVQPGDTVFSNHRCHGHFLSVTDDVTGLISEVMGKSTGVCGGRGGSQHLCKDGFFSNGIQGGIVPVATGLALAHKLKAESRVSVCFVGDGTLGEGALYESLNIASKWNLPLVVILENNGYAQSTSQEQTLAGSITARAEAFGIKSFKGDTWNWQELFNIVDDAFNVARGSSRPVFIQIDTFRLKAHSKGDDNRPRSFVEPYEVKDPLNILLKNPDAALVELIGKVDQRVEQSIKASEAAPFAVKQIFDLEPEKAGSLSWEPTGEVPAGRFSKTLNQAFQRRMAEDSRVMFIGEDIEAPYGGAFKVSGSLSDEFPGRVLNAPISEAAIVGIGTGLALAGQRPFIEIMFGDFSTLIVDQIVNHAAKFRDMYNEQVHVNLVVRTPMGGGRGYGPTHSQSIERIFFGIPGLKVAALHNYLDPNYILQSLKQENHGPLFLVENKLMYALPMRNKMPSGFELHQDSETFPTLWIKPKSAKVHMTLLGYGGVAGILAEAAEQLFVDYDIVAQVFIPTLLYPFSVQSLLPQLVDAPKLLIVEEGQSFAAWGAEIATQCLELAPEIAWKIKRVGPETCAIPSSGPLEQEVLPVNVDYVLSKAKDFFHAS